MDPELEERREKTWDRLVVKGITYRKVCERLSREYNVSESAIEKDIERMPDWLPKLDRVSSKSAASRLRELRQNRQRLQQMAVEARKDSEERKDADARREELSIRRAIDKAIEVDVEMSQSVGETDQIAEQHEHEHRHAHLHEHEDRISDSDIDTINSLTDGDEGLYGMSEGPEEIEVTTVDDVDGEGSNEGEGE